MGESDTVMQTRDEVEGLHNCRVCFISICQFMFHVNLTVNSCGSLIFDVALKFTTEVAEDDTISMIQSAIVDGQLGELSVNVSYIPRFPRTTITTPTSTTPKSDGLFLVFTYTGTINLRVFVCQLLLQLSWKVSHC